MQAQASSSALTKGLDLWLWFVRDSLVNSLVPLWMTYLIIVNQTEKDD